MRVQAGRWETGRQVKYEKREGGLDWQLLCNKESVAHTLVVLHVTHTLKSNTLRPVVTPFAPLQTNAPNVTSCPYIYISQSLKNCQGSLYPGSFTRAIYHRIVRIRFKRITAHTHDSCKRTGYRPDRFSYGRAAISALDPVWTSQTPSALESPSSVSEQSI